MSDLTLGLDLSSGILFAFGFSPGPAEMFFILVIALLLYGGRLPEMARTWGKTLAEFRRSLSGIQNEFNDAIGSAKGQLEYYPEYDSHSGDSENETSGCDEPLQDENSQTEAPEDHSSTDDTSIDSDLAAEPSAEKQTGMASD